VQKSVFVLGAGASADAGLPTGDELTLRIAEALDVREPGIRAFSENQQKMTAAMKISCSGSVLQTHFDAAERIRANMPHARSDAFIDQPELVTFTAPKVEEDVAWQDRVDGMRIRKPKD
jgi:hypothetical protein